MQNVSCEQIVLVDLSGLRQQSRKSLARLLRGLQDESHIAKRDTRAHGLDDSEHPDADRASQRQSFQTHPHPLSAGPEIRLLSDVLLPALAESIEEGSAEPKDAYLLDRVS